MSTTTLMIVLVALLAVFLGYTLVAPLLLNLGRFTGALRLPCPERHTIADVRVNAMGAALTSAYGVPSLRVRMCTLLHGGERCEGTCLKNARF